MKKREIRDVKENDFRESSPKTEILILEEDETFSDWIH
jgi:hypothetical protein